MWYKVVEHFCLGIHYLLSQEISSDLITSKRFSGQVLRKYTHTLSLFYRYLLRVVVRCDHVEHQSTQP